MRSSPIFLTKLGRGEAVNDLWTILTGLIALSTADLVTMVGSLSAR